MAGESRLRAVVVHGQDRTGRGRKGQGQEMGGAWRDLWQVQYRGRAGQFMAEQGKGMTGKGMVSLGRAGQGKAKQFRTWQGRAV